MRKHILVVMTAILVLALATAAIAADDPFVGTWKLNVTKSKLNGGPPPVRSQTTTFTIQDNGYKVVGDGVGPDGKSFHEVQHLTNLDGKEHVVTGKPNQDASINTKVDANTIIGIRKKDGKEVENISLVVSKDGKALTLTMKEKKPTGEDYELCNVFDKQ